MLLLTLLSVLVPPLISETTVSAVGQAVFCPNNFQQEIDEAGEITLSTQTCTYIRNMLVSRGHFCYLSINSTLNDYCTLLSNLHILEDIVVFSKGHRGIPFPSPNHISLLDNTGNDVIDNTHIYPRTSSENVVTFMWHCETAEHYVTNGNHTDAYGYYGMPFCWTHTNSLVCYGDSESQVFLGWVDGSPQFLESIDDSPYNYAHVAYYFWYYMCDDESVIESLNDIASLIFGADNYLSSDLCDKLVIWGNRNLVLP